MSICPTDEGDLLVVCPCAACAEFATNWRQFLTHLDVHESEFAPVSFLVTYRGARKGRHARAIDQHVHRVLRQHGVDDVDHLVGVLDARKCMEGV